MGRSLPFQLEVMGFLLILSGAAYFISDVESCGVVFSQSNCNGSHSRSAPDTPAHPIFTACIRTSSDLAVAQSNGKQTCILDGFCIGTGIRRFKGITNKQKQNDS